MVVTLDRQDFLSFCRRNPDSLLKLIEVVCEQLPRTDYVLVPLLQLPAWLAKAILRIAREVSTSAVERISTVRLTQPELANMVGGMRERHGYFRQGMPSFKFRKVRSSSPIECS
jgi:hypothetical protein